MWSFLIPLLLSTADDDDGGGGPTSPALFGGNGLSDAGFLDGADGWAFTAGATHEVLDAGAGAPGRLVLAISKAAASVSAAYAATSPAVEVTAGQLVEAFVLAAGSGGAVSAAVKILDGDSVLATTALVLERVGAGDPAYGLPETFGFWRARFVASADGDAVLETTVVAAGGDVTLWLSKPYLNAGAPGLDYPPLWDPGPSDNPDLDLGRWPDSMPPFLDEGYDAQPVPARVAASTESGVPTTYAVNGGDWVRMSATVSLSAVQFERLRAFAKATADQRFWVVRPDTDELVAAHWLAEGEPKVARKVAGRFRVSVGLLLEPA